MIDPIIEQNCSSFVSSIRQSIENEHKENVLNDLCIVFSCIDNTTLNGDDTESHVSEFCLQTRGFRLENDFGVLYPASVCVYPFFVRTAKKLMAGTDIKVASVAGGFPSGQTFADVKLEEVRRAIGEGADEIDFVINRGLMLGGNPSAVADEVSKAKQICGKEHLLKVILETGELKTPDAIYDTSLLVLEAGADIIKTSTGKTAIGATPEAAYAMLSALSEYRKKFHKNVGIKLSGGISDPLDALLYYRMTKKIFGNFNIDKQNFRIGASRLTMRMFEFLTH